jgi:hypothetical protein
MLLELILGSLDGIMIFSNPGIWVAAIFFLECCSYIAKANVTDVFESLEFGLIAVALPVAVIHNSAKVWISLGNAIE